MNSYIVDPCVSESECVVSVCVYDIVCMHVCFYTCIAYVVVCVVGFRYYYTFHKIVARCIII